MRIKISAILLLLLTACTSKEEKLKGIWEIKKVSVEGEDKYDLAATSQMMIDMGVQVIMAFDGSNNATIMGGDTMKSVPYEIRNDSLVVHDRGWDVVYSYEFNTNDTLILHHREGTIMKLSRVKE